MDHEGSCSDAGPISLRHERGIADGTQCISAWQMTAWGGEQSHTAHTLHNKAGSFASVLEHSPLEKGWVQEASEALTLSEELV